MSDDVAVSMVERVAARIYRSRNGHGCKPWSRLPFAHSEPYRIDARAAIEAMREPTPLMVGAGANVLAGYDLTFDDDESWAKRSWDAMIDEALDTTPL